MLVCLGIASQAHTIDNFVGCGTSGRVKITGYAFDYDAAPHQSYVLFYITTNGNKNGTIKWQGKTFIQSNGKISIDTVPYYNAGQKVYWVQYRWDNHDNRYETTSYDGVKTVTTGCSAMPITLTSWTATVDDNDSTLVHLAWSVDMESNVAYYRIDASSDHGLTWDTGVAKINSLGNTDIKRTYTLEYRNPFIGMIAKTAGIGTLGVILLIAVVAGSARGRAMAITGTVACLMLFATVATVACKKDVTTPKQGLKYNAVKLNEVDKDGSVKDFATRQLKHK